MDLDAGFQVLSVGRNPLLQLKFGLGDEEQLDPARRLGALVLQRDNNEVVAGLDLDDAGVADQIDVFPQQKPERGLVEGDAVLGVDVEVLDGKVLAVGDDDLL